MTDPAAIRTVAEAELAKAREAMDAGNEGMARVCARRAAGHVLGAYYGRAGKTGRPSDAVGLLTMASEDPSLSDRTRAAALRLTTRVSERQVRPLPEDPAADARTIIGELLPLLGEHGAGS